MKNWAQEVFQAAAAPEPLDQPLELAVESLDRLFRVAWWCGDEARPAVRLELPDETPLSLDWERAGFFADQQGRLVWLGVAVSEARWEHLRAMGRLGVCLRALPDGTQLDLATSGGTPVRALGVVRQGRWQLSHFSPPLAAATLGRALELSRLSEEGVELLASDEATAEAAEESLIVEWLIDEDSNPGLERQGRALRAVSPDDDNSDWLQLFAIHLFMHEKEFCQAFGLAEKLAEVVRETREHNAIMQGLGQQIAQNVNRAMGLNQGDLLLQGKKAQFYRSDLRQSKWLPASEVDLSDRQLAEIGFEPVGDFVNTQATGVVFRGYACPERDCWGAINAASNRLYIREFFSQAEDGSRLTTTSLPFAQEKPEKRLFKQVLPTLAPAELLRAHRARLAELGWNLRECPSDLTELARSVDEYLVLWK